MKNNVNKTFSPNKKFEDLLHIAIKNNFADLIIHETKGVSVILPTKDSRLFKEFNSTITDIPSFFGESLKEIINNSELESKFNFGDINNISIGINYTLKEKSEDDENKKSSDDILNNLNEISTNDLLKDISNLETVSEEKNETNENLSEKKSDIIRLRCTIIKEISGSQIQIRIGSNNLKNYKDLAISDEFKNLFYEGSGLILIVGPTSSGKTTNINSLLKERLEKKFTHVVTIEDPIEYIYEPHGLRGIVTQLEVGNSTDSFLTGLKTALRLTPQVIFIGEIRTQEEANAVLEAVSGGHLVVSTMHTDNVAGAIQKFIKWVGDDIQIFADNLKGIMVQKLIRHENSVIPIREILYGDQFITKLIKSNFTKDELLKHMNERSNNSITMSNFIIDNVYPIVKDIEVFFNYNNNNDNLLELLNEDKVKYKEIFGEENFQNLYERLKTK